MKNSKEHILRTAFRLFLQKNFKEVTMKEIVKETGLSKGAFYHYFESKEQLFLEVIKTYFFEKMIVNYKKLNHNSLKEFYHDYAKHMKKAIDGVEKELNFSSSSISMNYIIIMFDALRLFPGFKDKLKAFQDEELKAWTKIIRISRKKGEFSSPMTDNQLARMFIYSNDGIGLHLLLEGKLSKAYSEMITLWDNFYKEILDEN